MRLWAWACVAFAVLAGDVALQWQDFRRPRARVPKTVARTEEAEVLA